MSKKSNVVTRIHRTLAREMIVIQLIRKQLMLKLLERIQGFKDVEVLLTARIV